MKFTNLNLDNIKLEDSVSSSKDIIIEGGNYFYTPKMFIPFGLDIYNNSHSINLQFRNIKENKELQDFLEFIQIFEKKLISILNITEEEFTSQLKYSKYDPILMTKLIFKFNKIECDVKNKSKYLNIYDIGKNFYCKCLIYIDKVWYFKGKYSYKLKIKELLIE